MDTHSAHLVELNHIAEYRLAIQTTAMFENPGMRVALLDALDRWETATPLPYFLCVMCPSGHIEIEMFTENRLETAVLRTFDHLNEAPCAWSLTFICDRARRIWEQTYELYEFMIADRPPGTTLH